MAGFGKHATIGALVGGGAGLIINLIRQFDRMNKGEQKRFRLWELLLYTAGGAGIGAVTASLPDLIEPALSGGPNHRAFFHSLTAGGVTIAGLIKLHQSNNSPELKDTATVSALGLLSHLIIDGVTPKGLPLTGIKL